MNKRIDCRGLACPSPVLRTKEAIEKNHPETLCVVVDNEAAKENVSRFLTSQRFEVTARKEGDDFLVIGNMAAETAPEIPAMEKPMEETKKIMVMVATDRMGHGDDELGRKLMSSFLTTLKEMGNELWRLVFVNNGVKLTTERSDMLPILKDLENDGTHILVCGTCLTHFKLLDKKLVGETTNMLDIVTAMQVADKVISI
ncbi:MAG: sulfurtransferase-like selenium metabolism protein YedF [Proteobacteria bacterium]|nr:sulfurtransferase-like selenium metabolism protein YedF [Pseudomonadota bacterium]MBU0990831.1 sulfurtransferase-like selenium metabolism protein YedF [Pseudomonadota bacterium]MBU1901975.1 sulfurtransferase-like selenium metabolism protein YedF [Pseudomonadota bacterium]